MDAALRPFPDEMIGRIAYKVAPVSFETAIQQWGGFFSPDFGADWRAQSLEHLRRRQLYEGTLGIDTHAEIRRIREINSAQGVTTPIAIADVGCGNGLFLMQVADEQREMGHSDVETVGFAVDVLPNILPNFILDTARPQFPVPANRFDLVVAWQAPIVDVNIGLLENVLYDSLRIVRPGRLVAMEQLQLPEWGWFRRFAARIATVCERVEMGLGKNPIECSGRTSRRRHPVIRMVSFSDPVKKAWADEQIGEWCRENYDNAATAEIAERGKG